MKFKVSPRLKSRKFWMAIASAAIVFLNSAYDLGLNEKEVLMVIGSLWTFIGAEGAADVARARNGNNGTVTFNSVDERTK